MITYFPSGKESSSSEEKLSCRAWALWLIWSKPDRGSPNSSWPYSSCLLSCLYQMYLITWTLHSKLSVVSFVVNHRVLLSACCFVSKVCFLTAQRDMALCSLSSLFAYNLMRVRVSSSQLLEKESAGIQQQRWYGWSAWLCFLCFPVSTKWP